MAYSPTSNCNAANYNPNDILQSNEMKAHQTNYQVAQQAFPEPSVDPFWMGQKAGIASSLQQQLLQQKAKQQAALDKNISSLRDESVELRQLAETSRDLLNNLRDLVFDPVPCSDECGYGTTNQVPTLEGNIYSAKHTLRNHVRELEQIVAKIGGR